jgi:von Willebrand factor type A domain
MKLAAVCVVFGASAAYAEATFDEYSASVRQQPAAQLFEDRCDVDIELRGAFATIETRQRIVNPGPAPLAAMLEMPLPAGGEVTRFATRGDRGLVVDAHAPSVEGGTNVLGVDPAFLQREERDSYRIILQPIEPDHDVLVETTVVALATLRGGMLRLVLPARDATGKLTVCRGNIRATPGPGATVKKIHVAGVETAGARASFVVDAKDLAIDVELDVAGTQPIAWTQTQPLADGWNATLLTVLGPRVKPAGARKVVFVVDGSRSMDLVGRHNVVKIIQRLGAALPKDAEVEAVLYDREVTRVFGALRPASTAAITAISDAVAKRAASNGSNLVAAFAKAREAVANARGQSMIVVITDGVTGDIEGSDLIAALGAKTSTADVHAIVLDPATTKAPGAEALRAPVNLLGGAFVEVAVDDLDAALIDIDEWMRPAWLEIATGTEDVPKEVRGGGGFTHLAIHKGPARFTVSGHGEQPFRSNARIAPAVPAIAAYALASAGPVHLVARADPSNADIETATPLFEKLRAQHPVADGTFAFAILTSAGKVAKSRKQMVAGGGKYERVIAIGDPVSSTLPATKASGPSTHASAIAKPTLERLFRDQLQPKAFACYQRALGKNAQLAGTATFSFTMGRGEVTDVKLAGLGDTTFDACLVDAAYQLAPPLPDFAINADDQTVANYPLTFARRPDQQATIVLGDADSQSPIDIDGIQGGVPRRPTKRDTDTPLGRMRP